MKFYNIALALTLLLAPVQTHAKQSTGASDYKPEATYGAPLDEDSPGTTERRYIIKYRKDSSDYNARLQNAKNDAKRGQSNNGTNGRGNNGQQGNRGKTRNSPLVQERGNKDMLKFGKFLPRANAEVIYLDSANKNKYSKRDDVEYIEEGEGDTLHCCIARLLS